MEKINEKLDSIKLNRTSKGAYSWEMKIYYNIAENKPEEIIQKLEEINEKLKKSFNENKEVNKND